MLMLRNMRNIIKRHKRNSASVIYWDYDKAYTDKRLVEELMLTIQKY